MVKGWFFCLAGLTINPCFLLLKQITFINKSLRTTMRLKWTFWDIFGYFGTFWDILGHLGTLWDNLEDFMTSLEHLDCFSSPLRPLSPIIGSLKKPRSGPTAGPTDRRMDRRTDGRTDKPSYRNARTHLKRTIDLSG